LSKGKPYDKRCGKICTNCGGDEEETNDSNDKTTNVNSTAETDWKCKLNVCIGSLESNYWNLGFALDVAECKMALKNAITWQTMTIAKCKKNLDCTGSITTKSCHGYKTRVHTIFTLS
jgi:hypothetical protein